MKSNDEGENGYKLSRRWFDFAFENQDKVSPTHAALWFWIIELKNRLGWMDKFGLPTTYSMSAIGVKNYKTFKKVLNDLVLWKFIRIVTKSRNQHQATVIALVKNTKASPKQVQSTASIYKQYKHIKQDAEPKIEIDKLMSDDDR